MNEIEEIQAILKEEGFQDIQGAEESLWVLIHELTALRKKNEKLKEALKRVAKFHLSPWEYRQIMVAALSEQKE